jgi:hypothetical protein
VPSDESYNGGHKVSLNRTDHKIRLKKAGPTRDPLANNRNNTTKDRSYIL